MCIDIKMYLYNSPQQMHIVFLFKVSFVELF